MTTTLEKPEKPAGQRPTPGPATRFVMVRANLMPDEVLSARQTDVVRRRVVLALGMLVALLIAGYGASWLQTNSAHSDLDDLNRRNAALQSQQRQYAPLAKAQAGASSANQQLQKLTAADLPWATMLTSLRSKMPTGMALTNVSSTVSAAAAVSGQNGGTAPTGVDPLNTTTKQAAATLSITGTATDQKSVAAFADAIGRIKGVTSVLPTNIAVADSGLTFTLSATLTTDALGGRFTPVPTGGK